MVVSCNGIPLYYEKSGRGLPLLLLHGNGEDHGIFDALIAKLRAHFTIYAIDSRNHGQSGQSEEFSYAAMAEDIRAFIEALALGRVYIAGFSDGAILALLLAMQHADIVYKMALLGVNLSPSDFTQESYDLIAAEYESTKSPLCRLMLQQPNIPLNALEHIITPALVIGGEQDIFKPGHFSRLAAALPHGELLILPGHTHDSYIVHSDILYPALLRFFKP